MIWISEIICRGADVIARLAASAMEARCNLIAALSFNSVPPAPAPVLLLPDMIVVLVDWRFSERNFITAAEFNATEHINGTRKLMMAQKREYQRTTTFCGADKSTVTQLYTGSYITPVRVATFTTKDQTSQPALLITEHRSGSLHY